MSAVTPARRVAQAVVRRVFEQGAYADRALQAEARGLEARERALAQQLAFGTVQRARTLDHVIERLARPPGDLDAPVAAALRLGLFQLLFLDGVAEHAAVSQSVELAKGAGGGHRLVNAVLRRAAREGRALVDALGDATPQEAALRHSFPGWLADLWWDAYGAETARALMAAANAPGEPSLRANTLVTTRDALAAALPVETAPASEPPEALIARGPFDAHGHPLWREGHYMPQSRGAMLVGHAVAPRPGERVLDLCAAPGNKTTHLAALMEDRGEVVAVERHGGRAGALERTAARMRAGSVRVVVADAKEDAAAGGGFDRVLVDPPCSGLGTLSGRPDLRWRASPEGIAGLVAEQDAILRAGAAALRPGGLLVLSTCTLNPAENEERVAALLAARDDLLLEGERTVWPHRDGTDGFYVARVRHTGAHG